MTMARDKRTIPETGALAVCLLCSMLLLPLSINAQETGKNTPVQKLPKSQAAPRQPLPPDLTLQQALDAAVKDSPLLASKSNVVSAFEQREKAAKGALFPRVDAYSSYERLSDPQVVVPMKSFGGKSATFSRDHYGTGLTMKIPVFEGGRLWTGITLAELSKAMSQQDFRLTRQELIYDVTNVFNEILFLKDLENAQDETLKALRKLRADAKTRLDVGRLAPVDLMRIDTQVSEQEHALVSTRQEKVRAFETLAQLMGRQSDQIRDIRGRLREHDTGGIKRSTAELARLILARPDMQRAKKEMKLAEKTIRYQKGLNLPRLDLVGDYGRRAGSGFDGDEEVWTAGVVLGLNIFAGGVISAKVGEAEARYLAARNSYEHLRLNALKEAGHAVSEIMEAGKRLETARMALKTARESFRIEEIRYRTGAGTVTDSLLSQAAWLRAQANVYQALYDCEKAMMDYKLAIGKVGI